MLLSPYAFEFWVYKANCTLEQMMDWLEGYLTPRFRLMKRHRYLYFFDSAVMLFITVDGNQNQFRLIAKGSFLPLEREDHLSLSQRIAQATFCTLERRAFYVDYLGGNIEWVE